MDWFNDLIVNNWDKVLAWLSMIPAGTLIWKLGNIFVKLIQNWTAKKYTKKQKEYTERLESTINGLKDFVKETIKAEVGSYVGTIQNTFNELEQKKQKAKEEIYEGIFGAKMEVKEIVQEIKQDVETEIQSISEEIPELEETIKPVEESEPEPQKKVDLL